MLTTYRLERCLDPRHSEAVKTDNPVWEFFQATETVRLVATTTLSPAVSTTHVTYRNDSTFH
jgi:hypothetical protein